MLYPAVHKYKIIFYTKFYTKGLRIRLNKFLLKYKLTV